MLNMFVNLLTSSERDGGDQERNSRELLLIKPAPTASGGGTGVGNRGAVSLETRLCPAVLARPPLALHVFLAPTQEETPFFRPAKSLQMSSE